MQTQMAHEELQTLRRERLRKVELRRLKPKKTKQQGQGSSQLSPFCQNKQRKDVHEARSESLRRAVALLQHPKQLSGPAAVRQILEETLEGGSRKLQRNSLPYSKPNATGKKFHQPPKKFAQFVEPLQRTRYSFSTSIQNRSIPRTGILRANELAGLLRVHSTF